MAQRRNLVVRGVIIPTLEERQAQSWDVNVYVERLPDQRYVNTKYPRDESFYGYCQVLLEDVVLQTVELRFERQQVLSISRELLQVQYNLLCFLKKTTDALEATDPAFSTLLTLPFINVDRIVFQLFSNTTLTVELVDTPFNESCDEVVLAFESVGGSENPKPDVAPENPLDPPFDVGTPSYFPPDDGGDTYSPATPPATGTWTATIDFFDNEVAFNCTGKTGTVSVPGVANSPPVVVRTPTTICSSGELVTWRTAQGAANISCDCSSTIRDIRFTQ